MSLVYFLRRKDGVGPVKIGCSVIPESRLKTYQTWSPEPLEIVAMAAGTFTDERRLHCQFAEYRLHAEWFEAAPAVLSVMNRVAATGELPPPDPMDRTVQVLAMFEGGATMQAIADKFGVSRQRVDQILRKSGAEKRGHVGYKRAPVWDQLPQVRSLAAAGLSYGQIATAVGDARQNVYVACKQEGIEVAKAKKQPLPQTVEKADQVAADYKAGLTTYEMAVKYSCPQPTIYRYLQVAGIAPNRNKRAVDLPADGIALAYIQGATISDLMAAHSATSGAIMRCLEGRAPIRSKAENDAIRMARVIAANKRRAA